MRNTEEIIVEIKRLLRCAEQSHHTAIYYQSWDTKRYEGDIRTLKHLLTYIEGQDSKCAED